LPLVAGARLEDLLELRLHGDVLDEVPSHPQIAARHSLEPPSRREAPALGQDTDEVLSELGYDRAGIDAMRAGNVI
ncbi:MAG TPA: hypothetical protein VI172_09645, partial [Candidatus Dormibacteraeota bacterium]